MNKVSTLAAILLVHAAGCAGSHSNDDLGPRAETPASASGPDGGAPGGSDAAQVPPSTSDAIANAWVGSWTRAHEEPGNVFYPTESREWPAARFRERLDLNADGTCERRYLEPADAHEMTPCQWAVEPTDPAILIVRAPGDNLIARLLVTGPDHDALTLGLLEGPGLSCFCCEFISQVCP